MEDTNLSKTNYAYEYIKKNLKDGKWKFGEEISVIETAKELGYSRRPIIDALKKLELENFVEIVPQTGCRVINYTKEQMYDHFLTVMVLEGMAAQLAAERGQESEVDHLYQINDELHQLVMKDNFAKDEYFVINRKLHHSILEMARSEKIYNLTKNQWDLNDFYLINVSLFEHDPSQTIEEHKAIIDKIKMRDSKGARSIMESHILKFAAIVGNSKILN
ncbi:MULTISPECIES: GntR family transcriptional regulator [unclassified Paenibacillus]|uniref:GntR family transcriptional regulator n=1 Tax=unclassified Paenibacillus TaxID=185978 RepID=UPI001AE8BB41|nr:MULTISPECIES: GntR family transcriptional regulator [unclassified Paenibacillus]MBP1157152.1 DNA-binding GntR family transcriptional regulator [Paenibacillus sp. PvP091]MBP1172109.1 DNA-binding GntR family transcriptional regulator [Paenibacillus sp. PvR098]MBP2438490.1 DNA-binding GntR family transcriptional regulator [Paenibacillus sp. PvP052]